MEVIPEMPVSYNPRAYTECQSNPSRRNGEAVSLMHRILSGRIRDRDLAECCLQLAVMLQARVPLHRAVKVLSKQTRHRRMKEVIDGISRDIDQGHTLSKALARQPGVFDNLFVVTAEVGQESGRLADVFSRLANHLERMSSLKRKFFQTLTYPALVLGVALFAVLFLLIFIVPTFAQMFKGVQTGLPWSTGIVLRISEFVVSYGVHAIIALVVTVYVFWQWSRVLSFREKLRMFLLKLPVIGDVCLKTYLARFCRSLGTMLETDVALVDALEIAERLAGNAEMKQEIRQIAKHVRRGDPLSQPFVESRYFPPVLAQMISVGEETDELDTMLLKIADYYEQELDNKIESLSSIIEPALILFLGLIVGAILISMYLPMFDLVNVVGNG